MNPIYGSIIKALLNELYAHLLANAVSVPGETTDLLCRMA
jgi:hypothetical protein